MPNTNADESGFEFHQATSERTVLSNVNRTLASLLPEVVSSNPTVQWLRSFEERSGDGELWGLGDRGARDRDFADGIFATRRLGRAFLLQSIIRPAIQARLDFLMQALFPVARVISVSDRAIEFVMESREPEHIAMTLDILRNSQHSDKARLSAAAEESLPNLLAVTADLHQQRRGAALQAFEVWLAEANAFRSAFEPADEALKRVSRDARHGYRYGDPRLSKGYRSDSLSKGYRFDSLSKGYRSDIGLDFIRNLAPLVAYLSRNPRLGSTNAPENPATINQRPLTLSPGEIAGVVAVLQSFTEPDESVRSRDYDMATHELAGAFFELSREPIVHAELTALQRRIANFDPFSVPLVGPPSESLQAEMRNHVLSNRARSPWLRQFLTQFGDEPLWWSGNIQFGSAQNSVYVQTLAFSAHSTVVRSLIDERHNVGETWAEYIERLFREWLRHLRKAIARSSDSPWTRENFIAIMAAVSEWLRRDGYRLTIDDQVLGSIWDSALEE